MLLKGFTSWLLLLVPSGCRETLALVFCLLLVMLILGGLLQIPGGSCYYVKGCCEFLEYCSSFMVVVANSWESLLKKGRLWCSLLLPGDWY